MNDDWDGTGISSFSSLMRETRRCDGAGMEEREREEERIMWIDHGPNEGDEETLVRERRKRETSKDRQISRERSRADRI